MATSAVSTATNIDCVIDAFDRERQAIGQEQAAKLAVLAAAQTTRNAAPGDNSPRFTGMTFTQWAKDKINTFVGGSDHTIEPVAHGTLIAQYLQANIDFVSAEGRHWVSTQCMPYVDAKLDDTPRSLFLCTKLYRKAGQEVRVLESLKGFAFHPIGRMLKAAAADSKPKKDKELKRDAFAVLQSDLYSTKAKVAQFHQNLETDFLSKFRGRYQTLMAKLDGEDLCNLRAFLQSALPEPSNKAVAVLRAVSAVVLNEGIKTSKDNCQLIRNVLAGHPQLLLESPSSPAFAKLGDLIIGRIHNKKSIKSLEANVFFPLCIAAIVETGDHSRVKELKVCKETLKEAMDLPFGEPQFAVDVLESPAHIGLLKEAMAEAVTEVRNHRSGDFATFPALVKGNWANSVAGGFQWVSKLRPVRETSKLDSALFTPLILSLEDILSTKGVKPETILTPAFLEGFKKVAKGTVFVANPVTDFLETYKTSTIKTLGAQGKLIKENQFRTKLARKCRQLVNPGHKNVCVYLSRDLEVTKFLHYRYLDAIFDLIVDRVEERLSKVNVKSSDVLVISQMAAEAVNHLFVEFEEELGRLRDLQPDLVAGHGPVKSLFYILVVKTVFMDGTGLLPPSSLEYLADYVNKHSAALRDEKIRHFEFAKLMNGLQSSVAARSAQNEEQVARMKGGKVEGIDADIKEFGMTSAEKGELRRHLPLIFRNYAKLSENLKTRLTRCQFVDAVLRDELKACQEKNKAKCTHINPFLLLVPCPEGYNVDQRGHCFASCPDSFTSHDLRFCKKPSAQLVELRRVGGQEEYKCLPGFNQEGVLCIPRCPVGWKNYGDLCERPVRPFDYSTEVVLVK